MTNGVTPYVAVVAARNEVESIRKSIRSVLNQTAPPLVCILVDDSSTDDTPKFAAEEGAEIIILNKPRFKVRGVNQVTALMTGVQTATRSHPDWEFLLKFDADTVIPIHYVQCLLAAMEADKKLGVCSGKPIGEKIRLTRASDAAKLYRRECWDDIKGLDVWTAFDSHALLKAVQAGWRVRTIPSVNFMELRPSRKNGITRWILTGFERASFGLPLYHTVLAAVKNIMWGWPPILNSIAFILAHIVNPWPRAPNIDDDWIKRHALFEIKSYFNELVETCIRET